MENHGKRPNHEGCHNWTPPASYKTTTYCKLLSYLNEALSPLKVQRAIQLREEQGIPPTSWRRRTAGLHFAETAWHRHWTGGAGGVVTAVVGGSLGGQLAGGRGIPCRYTDTGVPSQ